MKDCKNCAKLTNKPPYVRECVYNPSLFEEWWNYTHITSKSESEIEKEFEGLLPFGCWEEI